MSDQTRKHLKGVMREAQLSDLEMETVAGGTCDESCRSGCSQCCETGSANRGGGEFEIEHQTP